MAAEQLALISAEIQGLVKDSIHPCVTCDIWSSASQHSYISFTVHWIDADFKCRYESLATVPFAHYTHTGEAIAETFDAVVKKSVQCEDWLPVVTTDGAANMEMAMDEKS